MKDAFFTLVIKPIIIIVMVIIGCCSCFAVLLIALSKPAINEVFLVLVSYAIIFTFLLIEVCLALTNFPR